MTPIIKTYFNGFLKFISYKTQIPNLGGYFLVLLVIKLFGNINYEPNIEYLTFLILGAFFMSSILLIFAHEIIPNSEGKKLKIIIELIQKIIKKYFAIVETALGLLIVHFLYSTEFILNILPILILYLHFGSLNLAIKNKE